MASHHIMGGPAYDAFQAAVLDANGIGAIATFNRGHFLSLADELDVIVPSEPDSDSSV